jgi:molecular chaperone DnaK
MAGDEQGVFGIDLGTTYSAIAYIDQSGKPVVAHSAVQGTDITPSVVQFESESNIVVGETAKSAAQISPDQVVSLVKRQMGNADWGREFFGNRYSAPAVSALILSALAQDAEMETGRKVDKVVITVPAYFGTLERAATRQAGEIAGLTVLEVIPEPVAAAISYGLATEPGERTILVFDLGGGTFDVTIIKFTEDAVVTVVTDGDNNLGGADWDEMLFEYLSQSAVEQIGNEDILEDPYFVQDLWGHAEDVKKRLSQSESRDVLLRATGGVAKVTVTRAEFQKKTRHLLEKAVTITKRALATAEAESPGVTAEISDVILVGGSSLMPAVSETLRAEFGWQPKLSDPHLAVAKGAALFAAGALVRELAWEDAASATSGDPDAADITPTEAQLEKAAEALSDEIGVDADRLLGIAKKSTTRNRLPKAIGIELIDDSLPGWRDQSPVPTHIVHQVPAQAELPYDPIALGESFTAATVAPNQDAVRISLWEQSSPEPGSALASNRYLESGVIDGLGEYNLPQGSPIELYFFVSNDGDISLKATEPKSGKNLEVKARIALLTETEIAEAKTVFNGLTVSQ